MSYQGLHPLLEGPYVWRPWSESLRAFPTRNLRNRWLYFIGDSLTRYAFKQLAQEILPQDSVAYHRVRRDNGSALATDVPGLSMDIYYYSGLHLTLTFTWFPERYPVGGWQDTAYPLIDEDSNAIPKIRIAGFNVHVWVAYLRAHMQASKALSSFQYPNAVVFNFGLHFATQLDPLIYELVLRNIVLRLRASFPIEQTLLVWRSTGYTHVDIPALPTDWRCQTPERIEVMNEVASSVMNGLDVPIVDFAELSSTRSDAAPDNRHYSQGNVRATYNNVLLDFFDQRL